KVGFLLPIVGLVGAATYSAPYCDCRVDKLGIPYTWKYDNIWLDIVFILDTSQAMGKTALEDAVGLIESLNDVLVTDPKEPFYSRVGVISMADSAKVIYNLNMTSGDQVHGKAEITDTLEIEVLVAFEAALNMFNDGLKTRPDRVKARQVIYYLTDSDPKNNLNGINQFKASKGVIVVNNFLQEGEVEQPGLKALASDGYYFSNDNYGLALQAFCKANCFCQSDKDAYGGSDPAIKASGGCYHPAPVGVPYSKAKQTCVNQGGMLAAIHDMGKARFMQQLMNKARTDYVWIGFDKTDDGQWRWSDQSRDFYTNWGMYEPKRSDVAKCAFMDGTTDALKWAATNCQAGLPYICQYTPCSVGNKNC
ncbi:hypothetical protein PMAYCL1PPCAC_21315, partial [Pristionchus mayeri]